MCYSKEVSLIVSIILFTFCFSYWQYYKNKIHANLKPFLAYVLLGLAIGGGGHQLSEFLSLQFQSQIIYKIGLVLSISSMYLFMRSLEVLTNYKFYSNYILLIIAAIAGHIVSITHEFSAVGFWVQGKAHVLWGMAWLLLFIYWHACTVYVIKHSSKTRIHALKEYLFDVLDISFVIAGVYVVISLIGRKLTFWQDAPSIWCTFAVIQMAFIPRLMHVINKAYNHKEKKHDLSIKNEILIIIAAIIVFVVLALVVKALPYWTTRFLFR